MRLIAVTTPEFWEGESRAISVLLEEKGFWRVHIRKPGAATEAIRELLLEIPARLRPYLSLHDAHQLAGEGLAGGAHLNGRNPKRPHSFQGIVSRSCHTLQEVNLHLTEVDYLFLSPIFDSISKTGYKSRFNPADLKAAGVTGPKVMALGGVTYERLPELADAGFGGAAMLSCAWKDFI